MATSSVEEYRHNFNVGWRAKKCSFDEQMAHFCMNEAMADVEFVFNRQDGITVSLLFIYINFHKILENPCSHICAFCGLRGIPEGAYL